MTFSRMYATARRSRLFIQPARIVGMSRRGINRSSDIGSEAFAPVRQAVKAKLAATNDRNQPENATSTAVALVQRSKRTKGVAIVTNSTADGFFN